MNFVITWVATYLLSFLLIMVLRLSTLQAIAASFVGNVFWKDHLFHISESGVVALIGCGAAKLVWLNTTSVGRVKFLTTSVGLSVVIFAPLLYWQAKLFSGT